MRCTFKLQRLNRTKWMIGVQRCVTPVLSCNFCCKPAQRACRSQSRSPLHALYHAAAIYCQTQSYYERHNVASLSGLTSYPLSCARVAAACSQSNAKGTRTQKASDVFVHEVTSARIGLVIDSTAASSTFAHENYESNPARFLLQLAILRHNAMIAGTRHLHQHDLRRRRC